MPACSIDPKWRFNTYNLTKIPQAATHPSESDVSAGKEIRDVRKSGDAEPVRVSGEYFIPHDVYLCNRIKVLKEKSHNYRSVFR